MEKTNKFYSYKFTSIHNKWRIGVSSAKEHRGFTLIELITVIAIIGLIASIAMVAVSRARMSGRDARKISDLKQINLALNLFYDKLGRYPKNYNCGVTFCPGGGGWFGACDSPVPEIPGGMTTNVVPQAYEASMQELVDAGLIKSIPRAPGGSGYCYFNWGNDYGSVPGALVMTVLEAAEPTVMGLPPSCRPWTSIDVTWCEQKLSREYCFCNRYD